MFKKTRKWPSKWSGKRRGPSTKTLQRTKAPRRFNWVSIQDDTCCAHVLSPRACAKVVEGETQEAFCFNSPVVIDCLTGLATTTVGATPPVQLVIVAPNTPDLSGVGGAAEYESDDITLVKLSGHILMQPYFVFTDEGLAQLESIAGIGDPGVLQATINSFLARRSYFLRAGLHKDAWLFDEVTGTYTPPVHDPWQTDQWTDGRFLRMWEREKMPGQLGGQTSVFMPTLEELGCVANVSGGNSTNILTDGSGTIDTEITSVISKCLRAQGSGHSGVYLPPLSPIRLSLNSRRRLRFRESEGLTLFLNFGVPDYSGLADDCQSEPRFLAVGFTTRTHLKALIETT